jgi:hypothetical protein
VTCRVARRRRERDGDDPAGSLRSRAEPRACGKRPRFSFPRSIFVPSLSWQIVGKNFPETKRNGGRFILPADDRHGLLRCGKRRFGRCLLKLFRCKTAFLSHLYIKAIILPRQARDKHRENSKKDAKPSRSIAKTGSRQPLGDGISKEKRTAYVLCPFAGLIDAFFTMHTGGAWANYLEVGAVRKTPFLSNLFS